MGLSLKRTFKKVVKYGGNTIGGSFLALDDVTGGHVQAGVKSLFATPKVAGAPGKPAGVVPDAEMDAAAALRQRRQRQLAAMASGRSDTLLTGPGGLLGSGPGSQKKLLGG